MKISKKIKYRLEKISLLIFPLTLVYLISITEKSYPHVESIGVQNSETSIYPVSLNDTLPEESVKAIGAIEMQGIMIKSNGGLFTAFYEYEADHDKVLLEISKLPFFPDNNISDLKCLSIESWKAIQTGHLAKNDAEKVSFFTGANADQYVAYVCRKSPLKHTILLDTRSRNVLHKMESI